MNVKKASEHTIAIALICVFSLFSAVNAFHEPREMSEKENRELAQFPEHTLENVFSGEFMDEFENYVSDQFLFRDGAVSVKADAEKVIGKKGSNGVHFGKDGYLLAHPEPYSEENLDKNISSLLTLDDISSYNITAAIVPTAFEVIKDKLPPYSYVSTVADVIDYIKVHMADSDIKLCDATNALKAHYDEYIYYKTDHHQTALGSYYLYKALADNLDYEPFDLSEFNREVLSDKFRGTSWSKLSLTFEKPDVIEKYTLDRDWLDQNIDFPLEEKHMDTLYAEEHLDTKDKYAVYLDGNHGLEVINSNCGTGRSLVVFKDSYAHSVVPFLANHFDTIHMIDLRYYNDDVIQYITDNKLTDILVLYNAENFMTDTNLVKIGEYVEASSVFDLPPYGFLPETDPVGDDYFVDAGFLGDSLTAGYSYHASIPAKFFAKASTDSKSIISAVINDAPIVEKMINDEELSKYYIMLGMNEVSFRPPEEYRENIRNIIHMIREKRPDSIIYLESVLPVAKTTEAKTAISRYKIIAYNEVLEALASEESCYYLNLFGCIGEEDGYLREGAASDGIHVGSADHAKWEEYLKTHAAVNKRKKGIVKETKLFAGGGKIDMEAFANDMLAGVPFRENLSPVRENIIARMFNMEEGEVLNGIVYTSSGATSEEFAAFETATKEEAQAVAEKLRRRVSERKADFEGYIPAELPNLENPVIVVDGCFAVMCISDDNSAAETVIKQY